MSSRLLIRGGCVLTLGARTPNLPTGDVLIEDGRISEVGRDLRARGAEIVDASDTIVMPGFVDAHRHLWKTLFRSLGDVDGPDLDAARLGPADVYAATLLGLLTSAETGTTTVVDCADAAFDEERIEAALQAHADAGLRTVFVHPGPVPDGAQHDSTGTARGSTAHRSPDPADTPLERLGELWGRARDRGLRIHAHVARPGPSGTALNELASAGLLGADVTLVVRSGLADADLDAVAAHDAAVVLAPASQMAQARGTPPVQELLDRGIRPGLGVDDELLAPADLFSQMRTVQSVQHAVLFDRKLAGKGGLPNLLNTRDTIRYATLDGARAAGLAEVTGSIEPGKQADLVLLRTDRPNVAPVNDPIGAVVWGMDPSNVEAVYVAGRPLVRAGVLEADVQRARRLALEAWQRLAGSNDRLVDAGSGGGQ